MFPAEFPSVTSFVRVNHKVNGPGRVATCDFCLLSFRQRRTGICCFCNDNRKAGLNPQISSNSFNHPSPPRGLFTRNLCHTQFCQQQCPTTQQRVDYGGYLCRLWSVDTLFSNILPSHTHFFLGSVPSFLHQLGIFVTQWLSTFG